jgi:hypothetical protein
VVAHPPSPTSFRSGPNFPASRIQWRRTTSIEDR